MTTLAERWSKTPASLAAFLPSRGDDPQLLESYATLKVQSASPAAAEVFLRMAHDIDVRHVAPAIRVPTLILHSAEDQICHVENAAVPGGHDPGRALRRIAGRRPCDVRRLG